MADKCAHCGKEDWMGKECKFCLKFHCAKHRLPENHECSVTKKYREFSSDMRRKGKGTIFGAKEEAIHSEFRNWLDEHNG